MKNVKTFEYKMSSELADYLLKNRKGAAAKMNPQEYLVNYVNEQCGLLRKCVRVLEF